MNRAPVVDYKLNEGFPQLIEDFISLEGEGTGLGIASLFLRVNKCNNSCTFCDTAYSIPGKLSVVLKHHDKMVDSKQQLIEYLNSRYTAHDREYTRNLTLTGGEPLLNIEAFKDFFETVLMVFPNVNRIIIETNGSVLNDEKNCYKLIKSIGGLKPSIEFILSISPKLNGRVSHAGKMDDDQILEMYKNVIRNYTELLDKHFKIQIKFVHNDQLVIENERLVDFCLNGLEFPIHRNLILIMPFTPPHPEDKHADIWKESKDEAAKYALVNKYRYSPRIHIDRRMD